MGIRLWDGQLVDDVIFLIAAILAVAFAIIFRANYQHFIKMLKDVLYLKERQNLFDETVGKSETFFRHFMIFQALFLCSIALFTIARTRGIASHLGEKEVLFTIVFIFCVLFLFFQFKQFCIRCWDLFLLLLKNTDFGRKVIMQQWVVGAFYYIFLSFGYCL